MKNNEETCDIKSNDYKYGLLKKMADLSRMSLNYLSIVELAMNKWKYNKRELDMCKEAIEVVGKFHTHINELHGDT